MTRRLKRTVAALMLTASVTFGANAQTAGQTPAPTTWTSADGGLHFTVPQGWKVNAPPTGGDIVFAVSSGRPASGSAGVNCSLTISVVGPTQPGLTQAAMNANLMAGAGSMTSLEEIRAEKTGGIAHVDGFLAMSPRILIALRAYYIRGGKIRDAFMKCGGQHRGELTMDDLVIARVLFDGIKLTP